MAQSHNDNTHRDARIIAALTEESARMLKEGSNRITAGEMGERILFEKETEHTLIRRLPDDPNCLRISIGEANLSTKDSYLVFRGDPLKCKLLLTRMLNAFRDIDFGPIDPGK
jgi:hypothetical protein